jgi:hypothetical protein
MKHSIKAVIASAAVASLLALSGCAGLGAFGDEFNAAWKGVPATMTTYTQQGAVVDQVRGQSFRVSRDERFDTTSSSSDGSSSSNKDSQVLLISLGNDHISHVGSTMVLAEDGLTDISAQMRDSKISFTNTEPGVPWLNDLIEKHRNLWQGKGKTIMIRSQDGTPVAIFAGNAVEVFATDVPKSTWFRVDGKRLLVYRADYTTYDNALLVH